MGRNTRKTYKGGSRIPNANRNRIRKSVDKKSQIIHCISQLKRFSECFKTDPANRILQFGYNLGRLQELVGDTTHPEIWWKPIEKAIEEKNWNDLDAYIEDLRDTLGVDYDQATIAKGC